jgi:hypothetical protein
MADVREYLVNYGRSGFLGVFRAAADVECPRGARVVIRSARGVELGTVLSEADPRLSAIATSEAPGSLLRTATPADDEAAYSLHQQAERVLSDAQRLAAERDLPLTFLDVEVPLEGATAMLHAVHWAECDATPLLDELSEMHRKAVRLLDQTRSPQSVAAEPNGCGKPDCGAGKGGCDSCSTGGGCSSGSCSRGSIKSAGELTAYFANLRAQMEAQNARVALH